MDDLNLGDDHLMDVNLCLHMNDRLGGHLKDDDRHDALVGHHKNGMDDLNDLKMGASLDVSRGLHMNDLLDDHSVDDGLMKGANHDHRMSVMGDRNDLMMVVCRVNRNCVRHDRKTDVNLDGNLCRRMSDRLDDHLMDDDHYDVLVDHQMNAMDDRNLGASRGHYRSDRLDDLRTNGMDDLNLDGNHVNRNYAPRDLKMDANLDVMSHHVMLMGDLNMSCDRMSHDHLRCDHQMMRHRDTNRMDVMNLDVNHPKTDDPMHLRRVNRRMMDDLKMVCLMKI